MANSESSAVSGHQLTLQAAAQIRGLIIDRVLLPGEKVRQVDLAEKIGVSRSPLREALRTLEAEGVVTYEVNRGYVVARLDDDDHEQILAMRAMLEAELFKTITRPDPEKLAYLKEANENMIEAIDARNVAQVLHWNREFHFTIFDLSPLGQFRREVQRLWQLSEGYSAAWWWRTPDAAKRINAEHNAIITALKKYDISRLTELSNAHRTGGHERTMAVAALR
ncbi:GntR family transcriptional regulator [Rhodococcus jostii]|uniref:DNA-binding transcriptional regulator, GntR family n=1 Tax=Rhodococcus jostii TaxID=132919 RepID=A0A1H4IMV4_RHOJO|nr:GntR family transcriptional regulator [Rhodococcus jostii]SEB35205.1 DNA-binding transcriptional regulator, GntR family [Rhodococcus jostii]